tara:strand:- start:409 stop:1758 length:1350 start_codon:yes stop_codon:yes gene_type:complete
MNRPYLLFILASTALVSCTAVGPDYTPPKTPLETSFIGGGAAHGEVARDEWWKRLNDRQMNRLVDRGLTQNIDIATALQRIKAANTDLRQTGTAGQFSGGLDAQAQRNNGNPISGDPSESATFGANYILDIFGGVRRDAQRAAAGVEAAKFDAGTVRLALVSGVVSNYIDARYFQEALALTRQNIASLRRTQSLIRAQVEQGALSELDLARSAGQLDTAIADLPPLEAAFEARVFAIATLLAEPAQPLLKQMIAGAPQPYPRSKGSTGVPANLLRNRPDVLAAERRLAAAVAGVGVAEAKLYPSVTLSGSVTAANPSEWSFGPALSLPILNQGPLRARRDAAIISATTAELEWRAQVLAAVEDVQKTQSEFTRKQREVAALRAAQRSRDRTLQLSRKVFELGELNLPDLLDAERFANAARISLAAAVRDLAQSWSALMVATGRGWGDVS